MRISTLWTIGNTRRGRWFMSATLTASIWLALSSVAAAKPHDRDDDPSSDRSEVRQGRRELRNDWTDVREFQRLRDRLIAAEEKGDWQAERQARENVYDAIQRELADAKRDAALDRSELRRDGSWNNGSGGNRGDAVDRWDDHHDLMDSRARLQNERAIASELRTLQWDIRKGTPRSLARERVLLNQFLRIVRLDAQASGQELREDRQDLRGDSRDQGDRGDREDRQDQRNQRDDDSRPADPQDDGGAF